MRLKSPSFWWKSTHFMAFILRPLSAVVGFFAARHLRHQTPPQIDLPVLCIGNFTLGGTGKTPLVIALAQSARAAGLNPGIVLRGYGKKKRGLHLVNTNTHSARDVGDEALLLARHAHVVVGVNRYQAAQKLKELGCDIILMDDGFQSRRLYPDYTLILVDGTCGIGNGQVFPAGPLRAPLKAQMALSDGLLVIGKNQTQSEPTKRAIRLAARAAKPIDRAYLAASSPNKIRGKSFFAFAGIGNPDKFFTSLEEMGGKIVQKRIFADHHFFKSYELERLEETAKAQKLWLATTAKDNIRLNEENRPKRLVVVDVAPVFDDPDFPDRLLRWTMEKFRQRMF